MIVINEKYHHPSLSPLHAHYSRSMNFRLASDRPDILALNHVSRILGNCNIPALLVSHFLEYLFEH